MPFLSGLSCSIRMHKFCILSCITPIMFANHVAQKVELFFFQFNFISFTSFTAPPQMIHNWFNSIIKNSAILLFHFLLIFFYFLTFLPTCQISTYNLQLSFLFNIWMQLWMSISGKNFLFSFVGFQGPWCSFSFLVIPYATNF